MKTSWAGVEYASQTIVDRVEGWTAFELTRSARGDTPTVVARIVYWDAVGQFALEMSAQELPLKIVEELIAEARAEIRGV